MRRSSLVLIALQLAFVAPFLIQAPPIQGGLHDGYASFPSVLKILSPNSNHPYIRKINIHPSYYIHKIHIFPGYQTQLFSDRTNNILNYSTKLENNQKYQHVSPKVDNELIKSGSNLHSAESFTKNSKSGNVKYDDDTTRITIFNTSNNYHVLSNTDKLLEPTKSVLNKYFLNTSEGKDLHLEENRFQTFEKESLQEIATVVPIRNSVSYQNKDLGSALPENKENSYDSVNPSQNYSAYYEYHDRIPYDESYEVKQQTIGIINEGTKTESSYVYDDFGIMSESHELRNEELSTYVSSTTESSFIYDDFGIMSESHEFRNEELSTYVSSTTESSFIYDDFGITLESHEFRNEELSTYVLSTTESSFIYDDFGNMSEIHDFRNEELSTHVSRTTNYLTTEASFKHVSNGLHSDFLNLTEKYYIGNISLQGKTYFKTSIATAEISTEAIPTYISANVIANIIDDLYSPYVSIYESRSDSTSAYVVDDIYSPISSTNASIRENLSIYNTHANDMNSPHVSIYDSNTDTILDSITSDIHTRSTSKLWSSSENTPGRFINDVYTSHSPRYVSASENVSTFNNHEFISSQYKTYESRTKDIFTYNSRDSYYTHDLTYESSYSTHKSSSENTSASFPHGGYSAHASVDHSSIENAMHYSSHIDASQYTKNQSVDTYTNENVQYPHYTSYGWSSTAPEISSASTSAYFTDDEYSSDTSVNESSSENARTYVSDLAASEYTTSAFVDTYTENDIHYPHYSTNELSSLSRESSSENTSTYLTDDGYSSDTSVNESRSENARTNISDIDASEYTTSDVVDKYIEKVLHYPHYSTDKLSSFLHESSSVSTSAYFTDEYSSDTSINESRSENSKTYVSDIDESEYTTSDFVNTYTEKYIHYPHYSTDELSSLSRESSSVSTSAYFTDESSSDTSINESRSENAKTYVSDIDELEYTTSDFVNTYTEKYIHYPLYSTDELSSLSRESSSVSTSAYFTDESSSDTSINESRSENAKTYVSDIDELEYTTSDFVNTYTEQYIHHPHYSTDELSSLSRESSSVSTSAYFTDEYSSDTSNNESRSENPKTYVSDIDESEYTTSAFVDTYTENDIHYPHYSTNELSSLSRESSSENTSTYLTDDGYSSDTSVNESRSENARTNISDIDASEYTTIDVVDKYIEKVLHYPHYSTDKLSSFLHESSSVSTSAYFTDEYSSDTSINESRSENSKTYVSDIDESEYTTSDFVNTYTEKYIHYPHYSTDELSSLSRESTSVSTSAYFTDESSSDTSINESRSENAKTYVSDIDELEYTTSDFVNTYTEKYIHYPLYSTDELSSLSRESSSVSTSAYFTDESSSDTSINESRSENAKTYVSDIDHSEYTSDFVNTYTEQYIHHPHYSTDELSSLSRESSSVSTSAYFTDEYSSDTSNNESRSENPKTYVSDIDESEYTTSAFVDTYTENDIHYPHYSTNELSSLSRESSSENTSTYLTDDGYSSDTSVNESRSENARTNISDIDASEYTTSDVVDKYIEKVLHYPHYSTDKLSSFLHESSSVSTSAYFTDEYSSDTSINESRSENSKTYVSDIDESEYTTSDFVNTYTEKYIHYPHYSTDELSSLSRESTSVSTSAYFTDESSSDTSINESRSENAKTYVSDIDELEYTTSDFVNTYTEKYIHYPLYSTDELSSLSRESSSVSTSAYFTDESSSDTSINESRSENAKTYVSDIDHSEYTSDFVNTYTEQYIHHPHYSTDELSSLSRESSSVSTSAYFTDEYSSDTSNNESRSENPKTYVSDIDESEYTTSAFVDTYTENDIHYPHYSTNELSSLSRESSSENTSTYLTDDGYSSDTSVNESRSENARTNISDIDASEYTTSDVVDKYIEKVLHYPHYSTDKLSSFLHESSSVSTSAYFTDEYSSDTSINESRSENSKTYVSDIDESEYTTSDFVNTYTEKYIHYPHYSTDELSSLSRESTSVSTSAYFTDESSSDTSINESRSENAKTYVSDIDELEYTTSDFVNTYTEKYIHYPLYSTDELSSLSRESSSVSTSAYFTDESSSDTSINESRSENAKTYVSDIDHSEYTSDFVNTYTEQYIHHPHYSTDELSSLSRESSSVSTSAYFTDEYSSDTSNNESRSENPKTYVSDIDELEYTTSDFVNTYTEKYIHYPLYSTDELSSLSRESSSVSTSAYFTDESSSDTSINESRSENAKTYVSDIDELEYTTSDFVNTYTEQYIHHPHYSTDELSSLSRESSSVSTSAYFTDEYSSDTSNNESRSENPKTYVSDIDESEYTTSAFVDTYTENDIHYPHYSTNELSSLSRESSSENTSTYLTDDGYSSDTSVNESRSENARTNISDIDASEYTTIDVVDKYIEKVLHYPHYSTDKLSSFLHESSSVSTSAYFTDEYSSDTSINESRSENSKTYVSDIDESEYTTSDFVNTYTEKYIHYPHYSTDELSSLSRESTSVSTSAYFTDESSSDTSINESRSENAKTYVSDIDELEYTTSDFVNTYTEKYIHYPLYSTDELSSLSRESSSVSTSAYFTDESSSDTSINESRSENAKTYVSDIDHSEYTSDFVNTYTEQYIHHPHYSTDELSSLSRESSSVSTSAYFTDEYSSDTSNNESRSENPKTYVSDIDESEYTTSAFVDTYTENDIHYPHYSTNELSSLSRESSSENTSTYLTDDGYSSDTSVNESRSENARTNISDIDASEYTTSDVVDKYIEKVLHYPHYSTDKLSSFLHESSSVSTSAYFTDEYSSDTSINESRSENSKTYVSDIDESEYTTSDFVNTYTEKYIHYPHYSTDELSSLSRESTSVSTSAYFTDESSSDTSINESRSENAKTYVSDIDELEYTTSDFVNTYTEKYIHYPLYSTDELSSLSRESSSVSTSAYFTDESSSDTSINESRSENAKTYVSDIDHSEYTSDFVNTYTEQYIHHPHYSTDELSSLSRESSSVSTSAYFTDEYSSDTSNNESRSENPKTYVSDIDESEYTTSAFVDTYTENDIHYPHYSTNELSSLSRESSSENTSTYLTDDGYSSDTSVNESRSENARTNISDIDASEYTTSDVVDKYIEKVLHYPHYSTDKLSSFLHESSSVSTSAYFTDEYSSDTSINESRSENSKTYVSDIDESEYTTSDFVNTYTEKYIHYPHYSTDELSSLSRESTSVSTSAYFTDESSSDTSINESRSENAKTYVSDIDELEYTTSDFVNTYTEKYIHYPLYSTDELSSLSRESSSVSTSAYFTDESSSDTSINESRSENAKTYVSDIDHSEYTSDFVNTYTEQYIHHPHYSTDELSSLSRESSSVSTSAYFTDEYSSDTSNNESRSENPKTYVSDIDESEYTTSAFVDTYTENDIHYPHYSTNELSSLSRESSSENTSTYLTDDGYSSDTSVNESRSENARTNISDIDASEYTTSDVVDKYIEKVLHYPHYSTDKLSSFLHESSHVNTLAYFTDDEYSSDTSVYESSSENARTYISDVDASEYTKSGFVDTYTEEDLHYPHYETDELSSLSHKSSHEDTSAYFTGDEYPSDSSVNESSSENARTYVSDIDASEYTKSGFVDTYTEEDLHYPHYETDELSSLSHKSSHEYTSAYFTGDEYPSDSSVNESSSENARTYVSDIDASEYTKSGFVDTYTEEDLHYPHYETDELSSLSHKSSHEDTSAYFTGDEYPSDSSGNESSSENARTYVSDIDASEYTKSGFVDTYTEEDLHYPHYETDELSSLSHKSSHEDTSAYFTGDEYPSDSSVNESSSENARTYVSDIDASEYTKSGFVDTYTEEDLHYPHYETDELSSLSHKSSHEDTSAYFTGDEYPSDSSVNEYSSENARTYVSDIDASEYTTSGFVDTYTEKDVHYPHYSTDELSSLAHESSSASTSAYFGVNVYSSDTSVYDSTSEIGSNYVSDIDTSINTKNESAGTYTNEGVHYPHYSSYEWRIMALEYSSQNTSANFIDGIYSSYTSGNESSSENAKTYVSDIDASEYTTTEHVDTYTDENIHYPQFSTYKWSSLAHKSSSEITYGHFTDDGIFPDALVYHENTRHESDIDASEYTTSDVVETYTVEDVDYPHYSTNEWSSFAREFSSENTSAYFTDDGYSSGTSVYESSTENASKYVSNIDALEYITNEGANTYTDENVRSSHYSTYKEISLAHESTSENTSIYFTDDGYSTLASVVYQSSTENARDYVSDIDSSQYSTIEGVDTYTDEYVHYPHYSTYEWNSLANEFSSENTTAYFTDGLYYPDASIYEFSSENATHNFSNLNASQYTTIGSVETYTDEDIFYPQYSTYEWSPLEHGSSSEYSYFTGDGHTFDYQPHEESTLSYRTDDMYSTFSSKLVSSSVTKSPYISSDIYSSQYTRYESYYDGVSRESHLNPASNHSKYVTTEREHTTIGSVSFERGNISSSKSTQQFVVSLSKQEQEAVIGTNPVNKHVHVSHYIENKPETIINSYQKGKESDVPVITVPEMDFVSIENLLGNVYIDDAESSDYYLEDYSEDYFITIRPFVFKDVTDINDDSLKSNIRRWRRNENMTEKEKDVWYNKQAKTLNDVKIVTNDVSKNWTVNPLKNTQMSAYMESYLFKKLKNVQANRTFPRNEINNTNTNAYSLRKRLLNGKRFHPGYEILFLKALNSSTFLNNTFMNSNHSIKTKSKTHTKITHPTSKQNKRMPIHNDSLKNNYIKYNNFTKIFPNYLSSKTHPMFKQTKLTSPNIILAFPGIFSKDEGPRRRDNYKSTNDSVTVSSRVQRSPTSSSKMEYLLSLLSTENRGMTLKDEDYSYEYDYDSYYDDDYEDGASIQELLAVASQHLQKDREGNHTP